MRAIRPCSNVYADNVVDNDRRKKVHYRGTKSKFIPLRAFSHMNVPAMIYALHSDISRHLRQLSVCSRMVNGLSSAVVGLADSQSSGFQISNRAR